MPGGKTKTSPSPKIRLLAIALAALTVVFVLGTVAAVRAVSFEDVSQTLGLGTADLKATVINIINWVLGLLALIAVIMILYAGYLWLMSAGNEDRIRRAKRIIINTVIGLVIILLAWAIVNFVIKSVGEVTNPPGGSCTEGQVQGCWECIGGGWQYNQTLPGCALQPDTFEIRNIVTSCGNPPDYRNDVFTCSAVTVVFNRNLDLATVQTNTENDGLTVEQCDGTSDLYSCNNPSQPTPLFNAVPPFTNEIEYSGAAPRRDRAEIVTAGRSLSFVHAQEPFQTNTIYQLKVPKAAQGIKDATGRELTGCEYADGSPIPGCTEFATYFSWNFRVGTQTDEEPPRLVSSYPVASGAGYPDRNVNRTAIVSARFSEAIAPWTISEDNIRLFGFDPNDQPDPDGSGGTRLATPIDGLPPDPDNYDVVIALSGDGFDLIFKNGFQLDAFRWYEIELNNLTDHCSNVQTPAPIAWRFETNGVGAGIATVYPPDGFQFACPTTEVFVLFNTSMYDPVTGGCRVNPPLGYVTGGTPIPPRNNLEVEDDYPGSGNPNDYCKKYSWRPVTNALNVNTNYDAGVTTRYEINPDGDTLTANWSFRTATPETCANPPVITQLSPNVGPAGTCMSVLGNFFDPDGDGQGAGDGDNLTFSNTSALGEVRGWSQNAIVLDAPDVGLGPSPVQVTVRYPAPIGDLPSNTLDFNFVPGTFTGPCLYQLNPNDGVRNQGYQLIGDHFNPSSTLKRIHFGGIVEDKNWTSDTVANSNVPFAAPEAPPPGAVSLVRLQNDAGISNGLPFSVYSTPPAVFRVIDFVPSCTSACSNASVRARFSSTLTAATVTTDTVELYRCSDATCGLGTLTEVATDLRYPGDIDVFFAESDGLDVPDVWYRAVIHGGAGGVISNDGRELGDLNFDADGSGGNDSFSWTFKTSSASETCDLATVDCRPPNVAMPLGGSRGLQSLAFSAPNACNPAGEELDPWQYSWFWTSNDNTRVTVSPASPDPVTTATGVQATLPGNPIDVQTETQGESAICRVTVTANTCVTNDDCVNNPVPGSCPGSVCQAGVCSPTVTAINPTNGAVGDWITVNGCYFGDYVDTQSQVLFLQDAANPDLPGLWPLPSVCGAPGSTWHDRDIIVEVPNKRNGDTNGPDDVRVPGPVRVIRGSDLAQADSAQSFTPGGSPSPGVCRVTPESGQAGSAELRIQGQNFGVPPPGVNDRIVFYDGSASGAAVAGSDVTWVSDTEVSDVTVPVSAVNNDGTNGNAPWAGNTNELFLENDGQQSNLVNFNVIPPSCTVCSADTDCSGGVTQGCSANGPFFCCAPRPRPIELRPQNPPRTCRNALVSASFENAVTGTPITMDRTTISPATVQLRNVTDGVDITLQQTDFLYPNGSSFMVRPPNLLEPNKTYRVTVAGDENIVEAPPIPDGVLSTERVGMNGDASWTFDVADTVCELARVQLAPESFLFNAFGAMVPVVALTFDDDGQGIAPIPSVYDWTWSWQPTTNPVATVTSSDSPTQQITSVGNGDTIVTATATAGAGWNGSRSGTAPVTVAACVTPWPAGGPYRDPLLPSTNFETWYCRDQGNLPAVTPVADSRVPTQPDVDELLREFFFENPSVNPATNKHDAVGMLVWENEGRLSPAAWYQKKFNKPAPAGTTKTDGYESMRVGTTVYIAGTNLSGGTLYTNLYVLGYNNDAGQEIVSIFNQMLERLKLNINRGQFVYDGIDAVTALAQVRRDTDRMGDLTDYERALAAYDEKNDRYPELASGSYLAGMSTSKWPSWTETFGAELRAGGMGVSHVDPKNDFVPDCPDPYDPTTCWDERNKQFVCPTSVPEPNPLPPDDSHLYAYRAENGAEEYSLYAHLEYGGQGSWQSGRVNPCSGNPGSDCSCFTYRSHHVSGAEGVRDTTPPSVPRNVVATSEPGRMRVVWELSNDFGGSGVQSYRIFRSANGADFTNVTTVAHPIEGVWLSPIPRNTTYYWRVKARDFAGNDSDFSNIAVTTTPGGLALNDGTEDRRVGDWPLGLGPGLAQQVFSIQTVLNLPLPAEMAAPAPEATPVSFFPTARAATSEPFAAVRNLAGLSAIAGDGRVLLTWAKPSSRFAGAVIRRKTDGFPTDPSDGDFVLHVSQGASSFTDAGLPNGVPQYYRAFPDGIAVARDEIVAASATPKNQPPVLSAVELVPAELEASGVSVVWTTDEPADSRVAIGVAGQGPRQMLFNDGVDVTTHAVTVPASFLQPNTIYRLRVQSENAAGQRGSDVDRLFATDAPRADGIRWQGFLESLPRATWNGSVDPEHCDASCNQYYSCLPDGRARCDDPRNAAIGAGTACGALAIADCLDGAINLPQGPAGTLAARPADVWAGARGSRLPSAATYRDGCTDPEPPIGMVGGNAGVWTSERDIAGQHAVVAGVAGECGRTTDRPVTDRLPLLIIERDIP